MNYPVKIEPATAREIETILREEANVLARILDGDSLDSMPHRVALAVRAEMTRIRNLAAKLNCIDA